MSDGAERVCAAAFVMDGASGGESLGEELRLIRGQALSDGAERVCAVAFVMDGASGGESLGEELRLISG